MRADEPSGEPADDSNARARASAGPEPAPAPPAEPAPTAAAERIDALDVLRGFALYGVLLANAIPWYSGRAFMTRDAARATTGPVDQAFLFLLGLLVEGKAMTLLTFLFGLGFSLQLARAESGGRSVLPLHLRRMGALALIGVGHVLLLWWGDILWGYALAGAGLALFRRVRGWKLLAWAAALAFVPMFVTVLPPVAALLAPVTPVPADRAAFRADVLAAITGHDRLRLTEMQLKQAYYHVASMWVAYVPWLVGRFLFGCWAGAKGIFRRPGEHRVLLRALLVVGLVVGLGGSAITPLRRLMMLKHVVVPDAVWIALFLPSEVGITLLTCAYAAAVVLLMERPAGRRALLWIAPVGRMALTTYLLQSVVCTSLFYGFGLGLAGRLHPYQIFLLTLGVFFAQIVFARLWLRRFRFGPMEWAWRSLAYARIQPLRRAAAAGE